MVMKRGSDIDSPRRTKRTRTGHDVLSNFNNDRYSPSESKRRGRVSSPDSRSLHRKNDRRTYYFCKKSDLAADYRELNGLEQVAEASVRISNLSRSAGDNAIRGKLAFEFNKFGDVSVRIEKRGNERNAIVYFRNGEDARAAKRFIENRGRLLLHDRPLKLEFTFTGSREKFYFPDTQQNKQKYQRKPPFDNKLLPDRRSEFPDKISHDQPRSPRSDRFYGLSPQSSPPGVNTLDEQQPTRTLFVKNLETTISRQVVRREFEQFGMVEDIDIKRPSQNQGSTIAFVKFVNLEFATKAKLAMHGKFIGRNRITIDFGKSMPTTRLWVGGLDAYISLDELAREFDRFGAIRRIDYNKGDSHAFILYDSLDAASVAAREMRGFELTGRRLMIDFADLEQGVKEYFNNDLTQDENNFGHDKSEASFIKDEVLLECPPDVKPFSSKGSNSDLPDPWENTNDHSKKEKTYTSKDNMKQGKWKQDFKKRDNQDESKHKSEDKLSMRGPRTPPDIQAVEHSKRSFEKVNNTKLSDNNSRPISKQKKKSSSPILPSQEKIALPTKSRSLSPIVKKKYKSADDKKVTGKVSGQIDVKTKGKTKEVQGGEDEKSEQTISNKTESSGNSGYESLQDIAKRFAVAWRGSLILKNSSFPVRLHLIGGNPEVVEVLLRSIPGNSKPNTVLRISQRLRLDQPKLEEVTKRMNTAGASGYCMLLALPGIQGNDPPLDTETSLPTQQRPLRNLVTYLKQKQAAGVVNLFNPSTLSPNSTKDDSGVLHAFPPCQYSHDQLLKIAPHLGQEAFKEDHLVVVVICGVAQ